MILAILGAKIQIFEGTILIAPKFKWDSFSDF